MPHTAPFTLPHSNPRHPHTGTHKANHNFKLKPCDRTRPHTCLPSPAHGEQPRWGGGGGAAHGAATAHGPLLAREPATPQPHTATHTTTLTRTRGGTLAAPPTTPRPHTAHNIPHDSGRDKGRPTRGAAHDAPAAHGPAHAVPTPSSTHPCAPPPAHGRGSHRLGVHAYADAVNTGTT